jgi:hypothetical protein
MPATNSKPEELKDKMVKYVQVLQLYFAKLTKAAQTALPRVIGFVDKAREVYDKLPKDILAMLIGFVFCFFGG